MSDTPAAQIQKIIADAAARPLCDAAYLLFRQQQWFNRLEDEAEAPYPDDAALQSARARSIARSKAMLDRPNTHNGPTFAASSRRIPPVTMTS